MNISTSSESTSSSADDESRSESSSVSSFNSSPCKEKYESSITSLPDQADMKKVSEDSGLTSVHAPNEPRKWLQKIAVIMHSISFLFPTPFIPIFYFFPLLRPILVIYFIYVFFFSSAGQSGDLSDRSHFLRSLPIWNYFASYFPAALHRTVTLDPSQKYIFGYHPHGIICHGAFVAFCTEALGFSHLFPGITNTLLLIESNFRLPIYREYALRIGLRGVSRTSCENILRGGPGRGITIVIGGARESLLARPGTMRIVLRKRDGFVKLAIREGAHLVPVLAFGENELYGQMDMANQPTILHLQNLMKKYLGWTFPLFYGGAIFGKGMGIMAFPTPLDVVVGKPIEVVQQTGVPNVEYVQKLHAAYLAGLNQLWEDHKDKFVPDRTSELEFV